MLRPRFELGSRPISGFGKAFSKSLLERVILSFLGIERKSYSNKAAEIESSRDFAIFSSSNYKTIQAKHS